MFDCHFYVVVHLQSCQGCQRSFLGFPSQTFSSLVDSGEFSVKCTVAERGIASPIAQLLKTFHSFSLPSFAHRSVCLGEKERSGVTFRSNVCSIW